MSQPHRIGRQVIALGVPSAERAYALQQAFSHLYWRAIVPAMEALFDRLVTADEVVQLDRLQLDLGYFSEKQFQSPEFIHSFITKLEAALKDRIQSPDAAPVRLPVPASHFEQWLYFLQHGRLPWQVAAPDAVWHKNVLDTLGLEQAAVEKLRYLLSTQPAAFRRLLLQHEPAFLQTIAELFTGFSQQKLVKGIAEWVRIFGQLEKTISLPQKAFTKTGFNRAVEIFCWEIMLTNIILQKQKQTSEQLLLAFFQQTDFITLRPFLGTLIRQEAPKFPILSKVINLTPDPEVAAAIDFLPSPSAGLPVETEIAHTTKPVDLSDMGETSSAPTPPQVAAPMSSTELPSATSLDSSEPPTLASENTVSLSSLDQNIPLASNEDKQVYAAFSFTTSDTAEIKNKFAAFYERLEKTPTAAPLLPVETPEVATGYFIHAAGVALLHPFLPHFFKKLKLTEASAFKNKKAQHKAAVLLHFLATGEPQTPEYALVLPKLLCGIPLNLPLDYRIRITRREQAEADRLLQAAIEHWGALGNASPAALREGFLQRAGKLEHRQTGWHLQVERHTIDILLDRLPWNLSILKLPWMEEMLRVEWR